LPTVSDSSAHGITGSKNAQKHSVVDGTDRQGSVSLEDNPVLAAATEHADTDDLRNYFTNEQLLCINSMQPFSNNYPADIMVD